MGFKQVLYLGHWILKLNIPKFTSFLTYAVNKCKRTKLGIIFDIIYCVLRYKISIEEYFQFGFYLLGKEERDTYVGTPWIEEYQAKVNPKSENYILHNKLKFLEIYNPFLKRSYATLTDLQQNNDSAMKVLHNKTGKIVLKSLYGEGGYGIVVIPTHDLDTKKLIELLKSTKNDFVEEYIVQHKDLANLSPSAVNTVRIVTQLHNNNKVDVIITTLRISVNSAVDNLSAGNFIAPVNYFTGIVEGPGVYMDITKPDVFVHPITGINIVGFKVPYWQETVQMAVNAALHNTNNRSIGWDIAITDNGPELVEGNHNWGKMLQMTIKKGLKPVLNSFLDSLSVKQ
ncbi:MAG: hexapeptide transferase [Bacteroidetes bacterium]|nr:hexapeptide transferase [Bacteroidota bacterium]